MNAAASVLDRLLDPVSRCFNRETASALVNLRADDEVVRKMESLAEKSREGTITEEEQQAYESYAQAASIISVLQAKARLMLRNAGAA